MYRSRGEADLRRLLIAYLDGQAEEAIVAAGGGVEPARLAGDFEINLVTLPDGAVFSDGPSDESRLIRFVAGTAQIVLRYGYDANPLQHYLRVDDGHPF